MTFRRNDRADWETYAIKSKTGLSRLPWNGLGDCSSSSRKSVKVANWQLRSSMPKELCQKWFASVAITGGQGGFAETQDRILERRKIRGDSFMEIYFGYYIIKECPMKLLLYTHIFSDVSRTYRVVQNWIAKGSGGLRIWVWRAGRGECAKYLSWKYWRKKTAGDFFKFL